MNQKRVIILICACIVTALILRHDLPIEFPGLIIKMILLFVKLSVVVAVTIFAYIVVGRKKSS
jgi:putative effector of murein hydrolase LrgA (UPF0299 family)